MDFINTANDIFFALFHNDYTDEELNELKTLINCKLLENEFKRLDNEIKRMEALNDGKH